MTGTKKWADGSEMGQGIVCILIYVYIYIYICYTPWLLGYVLVFHFIGQTGL